MKDISSLHMTVVPVWISDVDSHKPSRHNKIFEQWHLLSGVFFLSNGLGFFALVMNSKRLVKARVSTWEATSL